MAGKGKRTWWECVCGTKAMPLTDEIKCKCRVEEEQEWFLMPTAAKFLRETRRKLKEFPAH